MEYRVEEDLLGSVPVPSQAYWGAHTERARANFPFTGYRVHPGMVRACALVKKACSLANMELGLLSAQKGAAIIQACDEIASGSLSDQFPVDALQGGA